MVKIGCGHPGNRTLKFDASQEWIVQMNSPYSVQMVKNVDQNNSEYGHFLRSDTDAIIFG